MELRFFSVIFPTILLATAGCSSLDPRLYQTVDEFKLASDPNSGRWHSVRMQVARGVPTFTCVKRLDVTSWFKNADDPEPPDWYIPGKKSRTLKWYIRNSGHNFCFYVVGVADRESVRSGLYPDLISNPHGGWNVAVTKYKCLRLPFVSYRGARCEWYLGWRERGNFGAKVHFRKKHKSE